MTYMLTVKRQIQVKYLQAHCGVRYWEDAMVNGECDTDGSRIPCRKGTVADNDHLGGGEWMPLIDLDTGKIVDWPQGTTAQVHYKVCDEGRYDLLDENRNVVASINGYVPPMMRPGRGGSDYVIMSIGADGTIENWRVDLDEWEQ